MLIDTEETKSTTGNSGSKHMRGEGSLEYLYYF